MDYKYVDFAKYFKEKRKIRRITQQVLADKSGIKKSAISGVETGRFLPSEETIKAVAEVLNVSEEELITKKDESYRKELENDNNSNNLNKPNNSKGDIQVQVTGNAQEEYLLKMFRVITKQERREILMILEDKIY